MTAPDSLRDELRRIRALLDSPDFAIPTVDRARLLEVCDGALYALDMGLLYSTYHRLGVLQGALYCFGMDPLCFGLSPLPARGSM